MKKLMLPLIVLLIGGVCGCNSSETNSINSEEVRAFDKQLAKKLQSITDPRIAIPQVREYALEKLYDITDKERDFIAKNLPVISHNYSSMEYSFVWHPKGEKKIIEVITTPPPCDPIAVYRVSRVYYP
jgi:hypothetical protein